MRQRPVFHLARLGSACVLCAVASGVASHAQAVELGDTLVRSHIGQPLSADIELTGIVNEGATVQASLADAEVYRGANIAIHPAVAALNITIVRRDGKRFLHVTSPRLVDTGFVHLFFVLNENGRRAVRQSTLWFTPDPDPPPLTPASASPAPAVVPAAPLTTAPMRPISQKMAPAARPAACAQQFAAAQTATCAALDASNSALSAQIVELEEKVRVLTLAMQTGAVATAPAAPAPLAALTALPQGRAPIGAAVSKPGAATAWLFIGSASAAVLALVGVLLYLLRRKRKAASSTPAAQARRGVIASVMERLLPGRKAVGVAAALAPEAGPTAG